MSVVEFSTEYNLGPDIPRLLNNAGFSSVGGLIRASDLDRAEFGLKFGHVAEVKWALKVMLLSCSAIDEVQIPAGLYRPILIGMRRVFPRRKSDWLQAERGAMADEVEN
jgi:hypothetical protein